MLDQRHAAKGGDSGARSSSILHTCPPLFSSSPLLPLLAMGFSGLLDSQVRKHQNSSPLASSVNAASFPSLAARHVTLSSFSSLVFFEISLPLTRSAACAFLGESRAERCRVVSTLSPQSPFFFFFCFFFFFFFYPFSLPPHS